MSDCLFCEIASGSADAVILYQDADLVAFLDIAPIRPGHSQIIPRAHHQAFEDVPPALAGRMMVLAQNLAKRLKASYSVERVALLCTGGDVPHAHAHVVPVHEKTDVTSARYILNPENVQRGSAHLRVDREELLAVKQKLGFR